MAYENESNQLLITNIGKSLNTAENALQAAMRRTEELKRRQSIDNPDDCRVLAGLVKCPDSPQ